MESRPQKNRLSKWEENRSFLDNCFFRSSDLIVRGSEEHRDFWAFLEKYEQFKLRQPDVVNKAAEQTSWEQTEDPLNLPQTHNDRYRINFSIITGQAHARPAQGITDQVGFFHFNFLIFHLFSLSRIS